MSLRRAAIVLLSALLAGAVTAPASQAGPTDGRDDHLRARHSLRAPVTDERFYFVMADRFENGSTANDTGGLGNDPLVSGFDPKKTGFYNGGDLKGLLDQIDYIRGLGTTSIWLTPSFKNKAVQLEDGPSAGYHGYWITDFTQIDPHLGTNAELRALVDAAQARGMKVYFDIITNHTADVIGYKEGARLPYVSKDDKPYRTAAGEPFDDRDYAGTNSFPALSSTVSFPYTPVLDAAEQNLKVPAWLNEVTLYHNRGDTTFVGENSWYGDFFGLDDLFTEHPRVVRGMIDIYKTWIADFGVDGFRIDTMKHVNDEFWQQFGPEVLRFAREQGKREFFMFGEVFDTTKSFTSLFSTHDRMQAVLDFPFQDAARKFASLSQATSQLETFFVGDDWYTDANSNVYQLPTFLGNHDMGRIGFFVQSDNPGAGDPVWLARDRLAHELMYFSRGNPVIYYGDEQGFTGSGGDQVARQTLFASQVPQYLDDDLLGTNNTHAQDNFVPSHPLYQQIRQLAEVTRQHPALRNGAHQHRYSSGDAGIYAFSRIDRDDQREYVVALNNSKERQTAPIPTYVDGRQFHLVYGDGPRRLRSNANGELSVTVPPLSTVVYQLAGRIPKSKSAPDIVLDNPAPAPESHGRMLVSADVDGSSFYEVTFYAKVGNGRWRSIGTDDNAPYRVFHDTISMAPGTPLQYQAVVLDNRGHTETSRAHRTSVQPPLLTIQVPTEGSRVRGTVEVRAVADPELPTHVVRFERSIAGGPWTQIGTDDSSPVYTVFDELPPDLAEGDSIAYRAILTTANGTQVTSAVRTVSAAVDQE
jgi:glycosidase